MTDNSKTHLIEGSVPRLLLNRTLPMVLGIVSMMAFNLIDTWFVGRLNAASLAAIGFTFPIIMLVGGLSRGLGIGASAMISRAMGQGDMEEVRRLTTHSLILAVLVVSGLVTVGMLTITPVFRLLNADEAQIALIRRYMLVWYPGMVFVVVPMVGNFAIRATGDMLIPGIIMFVAMLVNVILDPLLIFGLGPFPRLELRGAAVATVIARATTMLISLYVLHYGRGMLTFRRAAFGRMWRSWRGILHVAVPSGATNLIFPLGIAIITGMIAVYGEEMVAAFGVASKIEIGALTVLIALSTVLGPFIGQNHGARLYDRVHLGVRYSFGFAMFWGLAMALLLGLGARPIAVAFNKNAAVQDGIVLFLRIVPISYGFMGILLLSNEALNVLRRPLFAGVLTVIHIMVLYVPLAHLGRLLYGVPGIFIASALAKTVAGVIAWLCVRALLARVADPDTMCAPVPEPVTETAD